MTDIFSPTLLVGLASGCYALGYLIINQMHLRLLVLIGSAFYVAYYATAAAEPLYGAIYTTLVLSAANLVGITLLTLGRYRIALPKAHTDIYGRFDILNPGDFRRVMAFGERHTLDANQDVTREGAPVDYLYYVIQGQISVAKRGSHFSMPEGLFIGEVAYLLNRPSAATTTLHAGAEIIRWELSTLRARSARDPRLKLAIDAMLGHDLAQKVAEAVAHPASPAVPLPQGT